MSGDTRWEWESPLSEVLANTGDVRDSVEIADSRIVNVMEGDDNEAPFNYCDLSPLPRVGIKTGDDWKGLQKFKPSRVNKIRIAKSGEIIGGLANDEVLVLSAPDGGADLFTPPPAAGILIPRRDGFCHIGIFGAQAEAALARLCAVPPPGDDELIQTVAADIAAILMRDKRARSPAFHVLCDSAYAEYFWRTLDKITAHIAGHPVGWAAWRRLFEN